MKCEKFSQYTDNAIKSIFSSLDFYSVFGLQNTLLLCMGTKVFHVNNITKSHIDKSIYSITSYFLLPILTSLRSISGPVPCRVPDSFFVALVHTVFTSSTLFSTVCKSSDNTSDFSALQNRVLIFLVW